MSDSTNASSGRRFGFAALFVAALVGLVGGGLAGTALAFGPGGFGGPFRHWGGHHGEGPMNPAHAREHAEHMAGYIAWIVDATPEQKQKLIAIADGVAKDLMPLHEKMRAAHSRAEQILGAPQVDRAAIEAFRAEHLALADDVSKRLAKALGDAAEVLTPQQRAKLAQHDRF